MNPFRHAPACLRTNRARVSLSVAAVLALLLWAFEWTWFKPLIQYGIAERSGRRVDFDALHIGLSRSLDPTVELRGLSIQNAAWAADRPFVRAGLVSFTFAWRTLLADQVLVKRLVLVDADVDLERQADGLRNWRLIHPDDRGPQHIKVLAVDATRSAIRVLHRGIDLDVATRVSALQPVQSLATHPGLPLTKWLVFQGTLGGQAFQGQTALSDVVTLGDPSQHFALRGRAQIGAWLVEAEGVATDLRSSADFDLDVRLSSGSLRALWPLPFRDALQNSQPVLTQAHVNKTGSTWTASRLQTQVGHTDLVGDLSFDDGRASGHRPSLRGSLLSTVVDMRDIAPPASTAAPSAASTAGVEHLPPRRAFDTAGLRGVDADVTLRIVRFSPALFDLAQGLQLRATLQDGVLELKPVDLGVAGGHVTGGLTFDASRTPAAAALDLQAHGLRLDLLAPALGPTQRLTGTVDARLTLHSQGESLAALVAASAGSLSAALSGATISSRLDAEMGLDGYGLVRTLFTAAERVPIECATLAMAVVRGAGKIHHLALETERTSLQGGGSVDLVHASFDLVVMPQRKHGSPLALNKAIHAIGSVHGARIELIAPLARSASDQCGPEPVVPARPSRPSARAGHLQRHAAGSRAAAALLHDVAAPADSRPSRLL